MIREDFSHRKTRFEILDFGVLNFQFGSSTQHGIREPFKRLNDKVWKMIRNFKIENLVKLGGMSGICILELAG